jgi:hypothetical protein
MTRLAPNSQVLRKRLLRFLSSPAHARTEIAEVTRSLGTLGNVVLFGGAVRDIALHGNREFPADIDIVLDNASVPALAREMERWGANRNKFGGYRFCTPKWRFDVWRLSDTWAIRQGHVSDQSIEALLRTTFFDWDAVAYEVVTRRLYAADGYFARLASRVVDMNLEENPNPRGIACRALSMYSSGKARLSRRLSQYVVGTLRDVTDESVAVGVRNLMRELASAGTEPTLPRPLQLALTVNYKAA